MSRKARIDDGGLHHRTYHKGRKIFHDDDNREKFPNHLGGIVIETETAIIESTKGSHLKSKK